MCVRVCSEEGDRKEWTNNTDDRYNIATLITGMCAANFLTVKKCTKEKQSLKVLIRMAYFFFFYIELKLEF